MAISNTGKWRLLQINTHRIVEIDKTSTVGRNDKAKICLRSNKASRIHATLIVNIEGNLLVQDLKSINGTFVNGTQISVSNLQRVFPGDIISFGVATMELAEDNRDKQCIYQVLLEEQPLTTEIMSGSVDSTTEIDRSGVNEVKQPGFEAHQTHESDDVIEISSSTDNLEVNSLSEIKIAEVCSIKEDEEASNTKRIEDTEHKEMLKVKKNQTVQSLNYSLDNCQSAKKMHPPKILNRRRTISVVDNQLKQSAGRNAACAKSVFSDSREAPAESSVEKVIIRGSTSDDDFGELVLKVNNLVSNDSEELEKKHRIVKSNKSCLTNTNNKTDKSTLHKNKQVNATTEASAHPKNLLEDTDIFNKNIKPCASGQNNINLASDTKSSNKFTIDNDNSIIIDITDDDDDMDFSCSQIFQMSQVVKTENEDDIYRKIKNELAEMDFCNEEIVLNTVPINLENDLELGGFENTQDICEFLQDGIEAGSKVSTVSNPDNVQVSMELSCIEGEVAHQSLQKNLSVSSGVHNQNESSSSHKTPRSSEKQKSIKPPIIEPHFMTRANIRQSARKRVSDLDKANKETNHKRKSSLDAPKEKKKIKVNQKSPLNHLNCNSKDINFEFKRRRSSTVEMDKAEKESIKEGRRKKLKDLASSGNSNAELDSSDMPNYAKAKIVGAEGAANRKGSLSDNIPEKTAKTIKIAPDVKPKSAAFSSPSTSYNLRRAKSSDELKAKIVGAKRATTGKGSLSHSIPKMTAKTVKIAPDVKPKSVNLPPSPTSYNLRRAKSSDELKVRKQNISEEKNYPITRHSTDVRAQPSVSARVGHHLEMNVNQSIDPRRGQLHSQQYYPTMSLLDNMRPLRKNGIPTKTPVTRRLANVDDITKIMVQWLPNWLQEQVSMDYSPPVNTPPATKIPTNFRNFTQYYDTFSKLVLLENWQYLFKGFRESTEQPRKVQIEHVRIANDVMRLDCVCYITRKELRQGLFYKPEDIILFECVINDQSNCYMSLNFGLIQNCRKTTIPNNGLISVKLGDLCPGDPHTKLEFTVLTRYQEKKEINPRRTCIVKLLANIRGHLMLIRAIKGLEQSPLSSMILKPGMNDYKFPITHRNIVHPQNLNPLQKTIVLEAASLCTGKKHGIYCVQGPPGTGKSTVIVNLIFQILFSYRKHETDSEKPPMILLAAPSNTAVDSLITKLVEYKHRLTHEMKYQIKLVRIGPESSISKEVIGYSLPKLAEQHVPLKNIDLPPIKAAKERNENMVEFSKNFFKDQYNHELRMCENLVIRKSNIICTTLNSCINGRLIDAVNRGLLEFTCCIIDEATQCHEAEALLPTILGIDKFVLVGDPQQLNATIMSRDASKLGFGQSLFTRLANNFGNDPRSPIKMLTDQYRMHPEICEFPNKQFYEGKLRSFPKFSNKLPDEIQPYLVFNCEKVTHSKDYTNIDEICLIKKLLSTIFSMVNRDCRYTVGIITPYNAQKDLICNNIVDLITENENVKITTNTVDSFQGSEFDIVIISCVRDSSNSFLQNENRLNVALTRAKQALYIIGNYTLFKECRPLYDLREDAKRRKVLLDIKQNPRNGEINQSHCLKMNIIPSFTS